MKVKPKKLMNSQLPITTHIFSMAPDGVLIYPERVQIL